MIRYERITFEKDLIAIPGKALADFVCPGHPLLDATIDLTLKRNRDLLRRGAVLVDDTDPGDEPRVLVFLEHSIQDARKAADGGREGRIVSKQMQFVEIDCCSAGASRLAGVPAQQAGLHTTIHGPGGRLRSLSRLSPPDGRRTPAAASDSRAGMAPQRTGKQSSRIRHPALGSVAFQRTAPAEGRLIDKTTAAVKDRLTQEIRYWDHRAIELKEQELAGRVNARLNSGLARLRADDLAARLRNAWANWSRSENYRRCRRWLPGPR